MYLKKLKKGKEPRPFPSYTGITNVPFVLDEGYSESEITESIESFRNDGLIKFIYDVFPGEMRYAIADDFLVDYVKDIWLVHDIDLRLLFERLVYYGKPKDEDKKYLTLMYGKKTADKILSNAYHIRKSNKNQKNEKEEKIAKAFIQDQAEYRISLVEDILSKHQEIIRKYEIPHELIDIICFQPLYSKRP
jgi:hypothetical protein